MLLRALPYFFSTLKTLAERLAALERSTARSFSSTPTRHGVFLSSSHPSQVERPSDIAARSIEAARAKAAALLDKIQNEGGMEALEAQRKVSLLAVFSSRNSKRRRQPSPRGDHTPHSARD